MITIVLQLDGKDILKYQYVPTIPFISYEEIEKLEEAILKFILYTVDTEVKRVEDNEPY